MKLLPNYLIPQPFICITSHRLYYYCVETDWFTYRLRSHLCASAVGMALAGCD